MSDFNFLKGPNLVHPEKPSAVGSRNSLFREGRDEYVESQLLVDEEVDKIINHINSKLPPEVLSRLEVSGNVKELLHNYVNQSYQNMYNRYITTVEDEMAKKFRDLVDREENLTQKKYTPRSIGDLLVDIGGEDKFNSSEIEKGIVNVYSHLQGHLQKSIGYLESETNTILRQKSDIGSVVRGENAYSIVKCSISNDFMKPDNVSDVVLSINILDEELHSPIYHHQVLTETIIKKVVSERILEQIDAEIDKVNEQLIDSGKNEMNSNESLFERFKLLSDHMNEDTTEREDGSKVGKYSVVGKHIYEAIKGVTAHFDPSDYDPIRLREQVQHVLDSENVRNRGFNTAVNAICSILDGSRLPYQHIENFKNKRMLIIRENKYLDKKELPDENYEIEMSYFDAKQLEEQRVAYQQQILEFQSEVDQLERIADRIYDKIYKKEKGNMDYQDLVKNYSGDSDGEELVDTDPKYNQGIWIGASPDSQLQTEVEEQHPTFNPEYLSMQARLKRILGKLMISFKSHYSGERLAVEARVNLIRSMINDFYKRFNPFHVQPGVVLMVRLSTIKRKQTTLRLVGDVLNEFLYKISKGFSDPAFANFRRRRSIDNKLNIELSEQLVPES